MNELEIFYEKLDQSNYDFHDNNQIRSELYNISSKFNESNDSKNFKICELERMAFSISKSFNDIEKDVDGKINGLGWFVAGTQTSEDGKTKPYYWPDVSKLTEENFQYFETRFKNCKNIYAKTEFGLLIYFGNKTTYSKHINFKKELFKGLFTLSQQYLEKAKKNIKNYSIIEYYTTFKKSFLVAYKCKLNEELEIIKKSLKETHNNWDIKSEGSLRILLDLSNLSSEYFKVFKNTVDYHRIIAKNIEGAKEQEKTHIWGSIYITDVNIKIAKKINTNINQLLIYKAELYLQLSYTAEKNGNMACVSFTEKSLRIYEKLKDKTKITEIEKRYSELRGKFRLAEIKQELPQESTNKIMQNIKEAISSSNESGILYYLIVTPWYNKIENILKMAEETKNVNPLSSLFSSSILDKYGNTIDKFETEEEKNEFKFWQTYGVNFQIGTQTMTHFFIESYKEGKINYNSVLNYLETTWLNESISRKYSGYTVEIVPIDLLKNGIAKIFQELDSHFLYNDYQMDFVTITDSLTLKIETLIRNFCEKIEIATFKTRQKGNDELVMEKLLDDLLMDIKHSEINRTGFDEEDRLFIKYVLTEKAGLNLRNQVAHGLMDINDYDISKIIIILSIILKISKYSFRKNK